jgi:hypothetical protein
VGSAFIFIVVIRSYESLNKYSKSIKLSQGMNKLVLANKIKILKSAWSPKRNFLCMQKNVRGGRGIFHVLKLQSTFEIADY